MRARHVRIPVLVATALLTLTLLPQPSVAQPADFCDSHPDHDKCGGGGGGAGGEDVSLMVTLTWNGIETTVQGNMVRECANNGDYCDVTYTPETAFQFWIPYDYWSNWHTHADFDPNRCFDTSGPLLPAVADGLHLMLRDHHGDPEHWKVIVDYRASALGDDGNFDHHAHFRGECLSGCPEVRTVTESIVYDSGTLQRTQLATASNRGKGKVKGTPCTCSGTDCDFAVWDVTVDVEPLP